jgi:hypothetical protein
LEQTVQQKLLDERELATQVRLPLFAIHASPPSFPPFLPPPCSPARSFADIWQFQNLQALIARNKQLPVPVSLPVHIPFLLIKSRHGTVINCEVADDRMQYGFTFSHPFELFDDATLMVQMGLQAAADGAAGHAVEEVQAQVSPARPARKKRG